MHELIYEFLASAWLVAMCLTNTVSTSPSLEGIKGNFYSAKTFFAFFCNGVRLSQNTITIPIENKDHHHTM